jgi:glycogen operon protein
VDTWEWHSRDESAPVWPGRAWPLGATWEEESTNFAVYAPEATAMWVCLFDEDDHETAYQLTEHSLGIWHGAIPDVPIGALYGLRAFGPWQPDQGHRFNPHKLLLDPYTKAVIGALKPGPAIYAYQLSSQSRKRNSE